MPDISVIIPVYNVERYLHRCVDSVLRQTHFDFDLILVDDGSPDRCGEICDEYAEKDARVRVIHQKNGGLSAARNAGIKLALTDSDSEWITFIDSDDWVRQDYLKHLLTAATETNCKIAICGFFRTQGEPPAEKEENLPIRTGSPEQFWCEDRVVSTVACGKIYKKNLFSELRYPVGLLHEDEFTTYKALFSCEKIAYYPALLYYYYQNSDGIMNQQNSSLRKADAVNAFIEQCAFFHKNKFPEAERLSAEHLFMYCAEYLRMLSTAYPDRKDLLRKYRRILRKTLLKYKNTLRYSMVGSKKSYMNLAHPLLMKMRVKCKHILIFIRRRTNA